MLKDSLKGMERILKTEIPRSFLILVTGVTGTLKSGFVHNVMSNYLNKNKSEFGVYATLEEPKESHLRNMSSLGIKRPDRLQIFDYQDLRREWKDEEPELDMGRIAQDTVKFYKEELGEKFTVFALDSLNALMSLAKVENPRRETYHFFRTLRDMELTAFFVQETTPELGRGYSPESYMVDGLIQLGTIEKPEDVIRFIQVKKMRATEHSMRKYRLVVTKDGLEVMGPVYEG